MDSPARTKENIDIITSGLVIRALPEWTPKPGDIIHSWDGDYTIEQRHIDMAYTQLIAERAQVGETTA